MDAANLLALKESETAYYFNIATQQMNNFVERLSIANSNDISDQLLVWNKENDEVLPQGQGRLIEGSLNRQLKISWGKDESKCQKTQIGKSGCLYLDLY